MNALIVDACNRGDTTQIKALAQSQGVPYRGPYGLPFAKNWNTCGHLLSLKDPKHTFSTEHAIQLFESTILKRDTTPQIGYKWPYSGFVEAGIFGLIFILQRNTNVCVVLKLDQNVKEPTWYDIGLVWDQTHLTGTTHSLIKRMRACTKRFAVVLLTIMGKSSNHANILIYDTINKVAERFDPYQVSTKTTGLDVALEGFFRRVFPSFSRLVRPPDIELFKGIQRLQENEFDVKPLDPLGFCQPFTFLYCECRLTFPDMDELEIRNLLINAAGTRSLSDFIRSYTDCIQENTMLLFTRYVKDEGLARQLKDPRIPMIKIAIRRLHVLNLTR